MSTTYVSLDVLQKLPDNHTIIKTEATTDMAGNFRIALVVRWIESHHQGRVQLPRKAFFDIHTGEYLGEY